MTKGREIGGSTSSGISSVRIFILVHWMCECSLATCQISPSNIATIASICIFLIFVVRCHGAASLSITVTADLPISIFIISPFALSFSPCPLVVFSRHSLYTPPRQPILPHPTSHLSTHYSLEHQHYPCTGQIQTSCPPRPL